MSHTLVSRANLIVFAVLVAMLGVIGGATLDRMNAARAARVETLRAYQVIDTIDRLGIALRDAETGQRGFLLTGRDEYLLPYQDALGTVGNLMGDLQRLTADDRAQQDALRDLSPVIQHKLEELAQTVQLRRADGLDAALAIVLTDSGRARQQDIEARLDTIGATERQVLAKRQAAGDARAELVRGLLLGGAVLTVLGLAAAAIMLNRAWSQAVRAETAQRTIALRTRTTLDSLSQGVGLFAPDATLADWNDCFHLLLALPRAILRPGIPYDAIRQQAAEAAITLETEDEIVHGPHGPGEAVTYERTGASGRQLEVRRTAMPGGGFVLTVSDMTKRAQAEAVLRESQRMQAIGQLTGGIAHDFNNLLTVILGNLEFTRSKLDADSPLRTRIDRGMWAAQRGATLTGHLLAFARKQPLAPAPIDLAATMPQFVPLLRRTLGEHIDIRYVDMPGLWPAMADAAQLESAILNLALNARDAMPGGGHLTIELANKVLDADYARRHAEVTQGDYVMAAVTDTGHGMTQEVMDRVFEPFFTTKPEGKGTGLGLAMVFGFVKQSGGHVKVYSEPGQGTTVRLYLPRAAATPAIQRTADPVALPHGNATILVVEDEAAVREIAAAMLRDLGYRVLEAGDGDEALRAFGAEGTEVDLLLTDVVLPGALGGRDLAERIAAVRPEIRTLFMSGYTENSVVHGGRLDDGVHLIGKPFTREQLARKVAEIIGREATRFRSNVVPLKSAGTP